MRDNDSTDQSDGTVSQSTIQDVSSELKRDDERKQYRLCLFIVFGIISILFLSMVLFEIYCILSDKYLGELYSNSSWHIGVFIIALLVILSSIGITIYLSLIKMASFVEKQGEDSNDDLGDFLPTTPQLEVIKSIVSIFKGDN